MPWWKRESQSEGSESQEPTGANDGEKNVEQSPDALRVGIAAADEAPPPPPEREASPSVEKEERFVISESDAREIVRLMFLPLVRIDHPAWRPTDEECDKYATEPMRAFAQKVLDEYIPAQLARLASKNRDLLHLIIGVGTLAWIKWKQVTLTVDVEAAAAPDADAGPSSPPPVAEMPKRE